MRIDLTNCDREPIHVIGRVQRFGALLAVSPEWIITFASKNIEEIVGQPAVELIGTRARDILKEDGIHTLRSRLQMVTTPLSVERIFALDLFVDTEDAQAGADRLFDVALHRSGRNIVIEAEPTDSAALAKFVSYVRPMTERVKQAGAIRAMCDMAARQMRALTGFDRVMIYRFAGDESGEVIAESRASGIDSFMGMHFPASDIPQQARELYTRNLLRVIADVADPTADIVPAQDPDGLPIDLTMSTLRAVSPIHIEYLRNMGVGASMSASIVRDGKLWGLFACHHYRPLKVTYPVRTAAELFAELFAFLLDQAERNHSQQLAARSARVHDVLMARLADGDSLISNFDNFAASIAQVIPYDGIAGWIDGKFAGHGAVPEREDFIALTRFLNTTGTSRVWASDCLADAFPPAAAYRQSCAGLLALPVSRHPRDFIVLFRREVAKNKTWAGNPEKVMEYGPNGSRLTPRKSFELWNQTVEGHCREWSPDERRFAEEMRVTLLEVVLRLTDAAALERDRSSRQSEFLIAELNHRVRNMLNLVRSLVVQSQANSDSVAEFARNIGERIESLARAHDQLTDAHLKPVSLHRLISTEARAYAGPEDDLPLVLSGPDFTIAPNAVTTMTLVIHELMTNARKYGALSQPGGSIHVATNEDDNGDLAICWEESGGPWVTPPVRRGFGSTILERSVPHELGGTAHVQFLPGGVVASFGLPAKYLTMASEGSVPMTDHDRSPDTSPVPPSVAAPLGPPGHSASPTALDTDAAPEADWPGQADFAALVVEDNMLIAMDAEEVLRDLGASQVQVCANVLAALDSIASLAFDVALLDVNLGDETSEAIAEALHSRGTPFIMTTGFGDYVSDIDAYAGAPVLTKPYTSAALSQMLAKVMAANPGIA